ncbi:MAG: Aldo-keto reductase YhdN [Verrucomicrobiae bacterium]|nr:Aldo-keto reductase YhdN [Verrucomicrobiae bacterium]
MEYRSLGRTGVKVSPLCLGCMMFGAKTELDDSCAIIDRALDAGINFLDTSNSYSRGRSEEFVGTALKRNGKRHRVVLATKVRSQMADDDPNMVGNHRRHIIDQCDASLRRLQTDYIDLYQIHRPQSDIPIDETLRALDDLVRAGKVRYIGTSTFAAWQLVESLWAAKEYGLNRFVCEQPPYNLLDRRIERELLPMTQTYGFGVIPWSPLGGGLLTGKYQRDVPATAGRYANKEAAWLQRRLTPRMYEVVAGLQPLAAAKNCTLGQLALAWCLQQPGVTSPIIGPRTLEHFEESLGALAIQLAGADRKRIDEIAPPGTMAAPFYESDFGPHLHRW